MESRNLRSIKTKSTAKSSRSNTKDPLKVVYISSPMKVRTKASNFRSLVQQLTGKNSDIAQYFDSPHSDFIDLESDDSPYSYDSRHVSVSSPEISRDDSPTSITMNSFITPMEAFLPEINEGFRSDESEFFLPDFFSSEFHALQSYDELF